jgi:type II secretory ATPase GspE/PulE/Tfp pilus assembly ATPase PilB-like protein
MMLSDTELSKVLTDLNYMPAEKLVSAQGTAEKEHTSLHEALLRHDYLTEDELGKVAAYHYQLPYVSLGKINIPSTLLHLLPEQVAMHYQTVAYQLDNDGLHIATAQPEATDLFDMLAKKAGATASHVSFATESSILSALHLFKRGLQNVLDDLASQEDSFDMPPIAEIVDQLLEYAYDSQASDLHIEPLRNVSVLRFRIDGVLHDEARFPKSFHEQVVARLKVLARLRTDEHLSAQDGRLRVKIRGQELVVRVSIVPLVTGEKVVMRLLTRQIHQFSLTDLGMVKSDLALVRDGFQRPFGMVLSTGPTGSGKTTTIYAIMKILNMRDRNIATIEDPVEYEIEGINQIQVNPKSNLTFESGLRSLLRQDPDVLFVGEIRDEQTAAITVNAAMTGHLVLSTMHTNDAVTTLPRLIDMGIEPYLVASTVNVIVGQRLVRQICSHCKESVKLTRTAKGWQGDPSQTVLLANLSRATFIKHFGNRSEIRVYKGNGCSACHNTGYQGRLGIFEVLEITPKLAQLISAKVDSDELSKQAIKDGMVTMLDDGLDKVVSGETTLSEIMRVTRI